MAKVSVLIAVYNASQFLARCLDSLIGQTMSDWQAICIDDCSTDDSLEVLQRYAERDTRFQVLHLAENHGQAYARNQGLKEANGDFVCFLDADDWFSPDALQLAVEEFEYHPQADCVLFEVKIVYPDHSEVYPMPVFEEDRANQDGTDGELTGDEAFRLSLDWQIHGVYMVRTSLHQRFPYDDTCKSYSDDNTTRLHFLSSRTVRRCRGVYNYWQHEASTTHAVNVHRFDFLRANESMKRQLQQLGCDDEILRKWETTRLLRLVDVYMFYHQHARELTREEAAYGLSELRRVWGTIDRSLINSPKTCKFGYRLMPSWPLFRLQEWLYFTLRGLMGKNKHSKSMVL